MEPLKPFEIDDDGLLVLFEQLGISSPQIGAMIGSSAAAVRGRINRARARREADGPQTAEQDVDELLELAQRAAMKMAQVDPVITHYENTIDTDQPIAVLLAGCMQTGGRWTFHDKIRSAFNEVMATDRIWLGLFGDEIENFVSGSFAGARSQMEQALQPPLQLLLWERWLDVVRDRVLWGTSSQHGGQWDEKRMGYSPIKKMYLARNIPFFDGQGYYKLTVGEQTYRLAVAHEFPGKSLYNPTHAQRRALWERFPLADVVAMADRHQYALTEMDVYGNEVEWGDRVSSTAYLVQIGTAKTGPDPYTVRGWERGFFGWPYMVLWPNEHRIFITRDYGMVRTILAGKLDSGELSYRLDKRRRQVVEAVEFVA